MAKHHLGDSPTGLFTAFYMDEAENVTFFARPAKGWKFVADEDGTLNQFREIADLFTEEATAADLRWLADTLASVETWLDTCPHDLARYGEIGVSF